MIKPTKVLCKRTYGKELAYWWDEQGEVSPPDHPKRHEFDDRDYIEGVWYDVLQDDDSKWTDAEKGFRIIDNKGNRHYHAVYTDEQRADFPGHCDVYGPRDYAKWFYTPEELAEVEARTYKQSFKDRHDISVFIGNYHWVKEKEVNGGDWVIALCSGQHTSHGKHWWTVMGSDTDKNDFDFAEIGHRVDSMNTQQDNKNMLKAHEELNDTIFPLLDSLKHEGTEEEKWHAPVAYHKPFVREAIAKYFDRSFGRFSDDDIFF